MIVMCSHIIHGSAQSGEDDSGDFGTISKDLILVTSPHLPTPFSQKTFPGWRDSFQDKLDWSVLDLEIVE